MKRGIPFIISMFLVLSASGQKEMNIWYFGNFAGVDFTSGSPVALTNSVMFAQEGGTVCNDSAGNLLFYSNGRQVYDASHSLMMNGDSLFGSNSTTQNSIVIPKPCSNGIYYLFTADGVTSGYAYGGYFAYSEIDMSLNGGLGGVTANKNITLFDTTTEKLCAIRHANNRDVWVIGHKFDSDAYYAYLVSSAGVSAPVITNIGAVHTGSTSGAGAMKGSPDGTKLAVAATWPVQSVALHNFDNATGVISDTITFFHTGPYGVEFSANSQVLYISDLGSPINQYDISSGVQATILATKYTLSGPSSTYALQRGPDDKIYAVRANQTWLGVINNPNTLGAGCNYNNTGVSLAGNDGRAGLPAFINNYDSAAASYSPGFSVSTTGTCIGDTTHFTLGGALAADSAVWEFGDGDTVHQLHPSHLYAGTGPYNVRGFIYNQCNGIDTLYDTIDLIVAPTLNAGFDTLVCPGELVTFDVSAVLGSYSWSNGDTTASTNVSAAGVYTVSVQHTCALLQDTFNLSTVSMPSNFLSDTSMCDGEVIMVDLLALGNNWLWQDGSTADIRSLSAAGLYWAELTDSGCTVRDSMNITLYADPSLSLGAPVTICLSESAVLTASDPTLDLNWSTGASSASIAVSEAGSYWVVGSDGNGCFSDTAYQTVYTKECILPCRGDQSVYIPNTFTPDDVKNNIFYVRGSSDVRIRVFSVYNRWGEVVFEVREKDINDPVAGWDGTYKGTDLPSQVFAYYLKAECEGKEEILLSGNVTLIR